MIDAIDASAARQAWRRVFRTNDAFDWPFEVEFGLGRMFYPTNNYHLTRRQFLAIGEALKRTGELGFLVSVVESEGLSFLERSSGHWACKDPTYEEYVQMPLTLENAVYSEEGHWGILISHEMHALIGGSAEFMAALAGTYRGWSDDLRLLREAWSGNPNAGWVEPVISHIART